MRIGFRKGSLDPKKLGVIDTVDFEGMSDTEQLLSPASEKTKSGRDSFKNELTKRFGSKYRDPYNTKTLMGELMPLRQAFGIMAVCMYGPGLPSEKHRHMDRLECWKNAAKYALNHDNIKTILEWPHQKTLVAYLQGLLNTALVCIRTDLPNSARTYGQHTVFSGLRALKRSCPWALTRMSPAWSSKHLHSDFI